MAEVPKRAVSKKAFFMHGTLVSAKLARKEITWAIVPTPDTASCILRNSIVY
jgi:hypothetical protein